MEDTIAAVATAYGEGGIGIIRISGPGAERILSEVFVPASGKIEARKFTYGHIVDEDKTVDEVMAVIMHGPKTYTCEDVAEINCHGGIIPLKKTLELVLSKGARLAEPGEFTKRAFLNGRLDLSQAEAVIDLIKARTDRTFDVALKQLDGSYSESIVKIRNKLVDILVNVTVNIDYPDEDIEVLTYEKLKSDLCDVKKSISALISSAERGRILREGIKVSIIGKPNVGKSSLLNAMLQEDKAIVTNVAGTTRDLVEGEVTLNDVTLNLIDTAGIRDTNDIVEKIGIEKSIEALNNAQLVILVCDDKLDDEDKRLLDMAKDKPCLIVYNKKDLHDVKDGINISAINNDIEELVDAINDMFKEEIIDNKMDTLNNERQIGLAISARKHMLDVLKAIDDNVELDLVSIDLNMAYEDLKEILGHATREDLLDALFSKFWLGK